MGFQKELETTESKGTISKSFSNETDQSETRINARHKESMWKKLSDLGGNAS